VLMPARAGVIGAGPRSAIASGIRHRWPAPSPCSRNGHARDASAGEDRARSPRARPAVEGSRGLKPRGRAGLASGAPIGIRSCSTKPRAGPAPMSPKRGRPDARGFRAAL